MAEDPDDNTRRILAVTKSNLAAKPQSLRFFLQPNGSICNIKWEGTTNHKADDLLIQPPTPEQKEHKEDEQAKLEYAKTIIQAMMEECGAKVAVKTAKQECAEVGITQRTAERAAKQLGLQVSFQMEDGQKRYYWTLATVGEQNLQP